MFNEAYQEEVAAAARDLWESGTRALHWSAGPMSHEKPWTESWADIYVPELCQALSASWLLTVVHPSDEEAEGYGYFHIEPDAYLVTEFADPDVHWATRQTFIGSDGDQINVPIDEESKSDHPGSHFYWSRYRHDELLGAEVPTYRVPVWSMECLEEVLHDWLQEITGLSFDLLWKPSIESPLEKEAREAVEALQRGELETFDAGDGVRISADAMDAMLQDPEGAAEVMEQLKKFTRE